MVVTVIGKDNRQEALAKLFNKKFDTIYLDGEDEFKNIKNIIKLSDTVILPLPITRDNKKINTTDYNITDVLDSIRSDACVFGGMCKNIKTDKKIYDYNDDEIFTLKNALYTAESAIALSILKTDFSLNNSEILIIGNGRIGKYLSKILSSFCINITVSARKEKDFVYIKSTNNKYIHTNEIDDLSKYSVIFNTVPNKALSDKAIKSIGKNTVVIDLASKNSGLSKSKSKYTDAKSLPAKYCKQSTAEALFNSISKILKNESI